MSSNSERDNLLGMAMHSDGGGQKNLNARFDASHFKAQAGGDDASRPASFDNLSMNGQEVFKWAVRGVPLVGVESGWIVYVLMKLYTKFGSNCCVQEKQQLQRMGSYLAH